MNKQMNVNLVFCLSPFTNTSPPICVGQRTCVHTKYSMSSFW